MLGLLAVSRRNGGSVAAREGDAGFAVESRRGPETAERAAAVATGLRAREVSTGCGGLSPGLSAATAPASPLAAAAPSLACSLGIESLPIGLRANHSINERATRVVAPSAINAGRLTAMRSAGAVAARSHFGVVRRPRIR